MLLMHRKAGGSGLGSPPKAKQNEKFSELSHWLGAPGYG